tara:strand:+ start:1577 stop:2203 length:627 start_codon:yes stop_codon:yes gene_type:complete
MDLSQWAENLRRYLGRALDQLGFKETYSSASENGVLLWDNVNGYPVVSKNGEWRQVVLEDGHGDFFINADVTASSANTEYKLTYTAEASNNGITLGTPATRIVFEEAGQYVIAFSAQISSTSASTVHFYFWPSVNGADINNSAMTTALHQNNATLVTARTQVFTVSANDYLEVNWMVDSTSGFINATAAASPVPNIPASTLSITRLHG